VDSNAAIALASFVFVVALLSARLDRGPITAPMLSVAAGVAGGPAVLGLVSPRAAAEPIGAILEITLVLVLLESGAGVDVRRRRLGDRWAVRLVLVALPGMLLLGAIAARLLLPSLSWLEALILAVIVAPTDDELRRPAVAGERFPVELREALDLEGGFSDGVLVAFLTAALAFARGTAEGLGSGHWLAVGIREVGVGVASGAALGIAGGALIAAGERRGHFDPGWHQLAVVAVAFLVYGVASRAGGSGLTAVFCAGMALSLAAPTPRGEAFAFPWVGRLLVLVSFALFGVIAVVPVLERISWPLVGFAALSLTVVRGVPVALGLARSRLRGPEIAFACWFGTRGIATVLFGLVLLERGRLPQEADILSAATVTVLASIVLHGATGTVFNRLLQKRASSEGERPRGGLKAPAPAGRPP
jgi:NhaP-type Na+/H+ or K+/H+ antiporter